LGNNVSICKLIHDAKIDSHSLFIQLLHKKSEQFFQETTLIFLEESFTYNYLDLLNGLIAESTSKISNIDDIKIIHETMINPFFMICEKMLLDTCNIQMLIKQVNLLSIMKVDKFFILYLMKRSLYKILEIIIFLFIFGSDLCQGKPSYRRYL